MKAKKCVLLICMALILTVACFAACTAEHTHTFDTEHWAHDQSSHWHAMNCGHDIDRSNEERHAFTDGVCKCGYKVDLENWSYDSDSHWHVAEFDGKEEKYGVGSHYLGNNLCECGYGVRLTYKFVADSYVVTGFTGEFNEKNNTLIIPEMYNGVKVTAIGESAFAGVTDIVKLSLPSGLVRIKIAAFRGCTSLTEITGGENITEICASAFEGCKQLTTALLPEKLMLLGEQVFYGCESISSVTVPDGIASIGRNMFLGCTSLSEIEIPDSITSIASQAFARCTSLKQITLPDSVEFVGQSAFRGSGLEEIVIPDSVTRLGTYAFSDCVSLKSAVLSKNISYAIDDWFAGCKSLESLTVPFVGANVNTTKAIVTAFGYAFGTAEQSTEDFNAVEQGGKTYYIPKSLKKVTVLSGAYADGAFAGCDSIQVTVAGNDQ